MRRFLLSLVGATATFFVFRLSAIATKFLLGAWIVLLLMPILILLFRAINRHYTRAAAGKIGLKHAFRGRRARADPEERRRKEGEARERPASVFDDVETERL